MAPLWACPAVRPEHRRGRSWAEEAEGIEEPVDEGDDPARLPPIPDPDVVRGAELLDDADREIRAADDGRGEVADAPRRLEQESVGAARALLPGQDHDRGVSAP